MNKIKALIVFGTRPEAIKLAPLIKLLQKSKKFLVRICITGQHKEMLTPILEFFDISPDVQLNIMKHNQSLVDIMSEMMIGIDTEIEKFPPDLIIVQGDTASTLAGAMTAFYRKIKIAYVEAGLRTGKLNSPFPEEANRKMISCIANYQFAPTLFAKKALILEGYCTEDVFVVGNTAIDAIKLASRSLKSKLCRTPKHLNFLDKNKDWILITGHRRENFGKIMDAIIDSFVDLAQEYPNIEFIYPVHLNPNVQKKVFSQLKHIHNFHLLDPQPYEFFIWLMKNSRIIITDSGGIQEEAPSLNIPVVVTRNDTERMEAVKTGACILAGTSPKHIKNIVKKLITDRTFYEKVANSSNPYGDGTASEKIVDIILEKLKK